ncbi:hypothetical protein [Moraxella marmotae]|uniref:hypothetical protein n=1 Tax=Moraxella marmotae TaxID=3344520 RepID=UPI0035F43C94
MMSTLRKTANGKVDKRTKEYKELVERAKKARQAKARAAKATTAKTTKNTAKKPTTSSIKRRSDGKVDLRTKEGKAVAERMARARAAKDKPKGIAGLIKKLLK